MKNRGNTYEGKLGQRGAVNKGFFGREFCVENFLL